jgi:hypothetical protein
MLKDALAHPHTHTTHVNLKEVVSSRLDEHIRVKRQSRRQRRGRSREEVKLFTSGPVQTEPTAEHFAPNHLDHKFLICF